MSKLKLAAFDLDGTLADTLPLSVAAFKQAVSPYAGHPLSEAEVEATFGLNEAGMVNAMVKDRREEALEEYYRVFRALQDQCPPPVEGIVPLLEELKARGIVLTLVTGRSEESCRIILETLGLQDMFFPVLTGSAHGNRKAECLRQLMEQYGVAPEECVYVGDAVSDVTASRSVGVPCLSAAWCESAQQFALNRANPGRVYLSVGELAQALGCAGPAEQ